jgi:hypothetical protein
MVAMGRRGSSVRAEVWAGVSVLLVVAVAAGPGVLAGPLTGAHLTVGELPSTTGAGFDRWLLSGHGALDVRLSSAVTFWRAFHVVKAVLSAALMCSVALLWRAASTSAVAPEARVQRVAHPLAGMLGAPMVALSVLLVIANVQGAAAPLSSLLTLLPTDATPGIEGLRAQIASGRESPAASVLIGDFRTYHAALAGCLLVVTAVVLLAAVSAWSGRARTDRAQRQRRRALLRAGILTSMLLPLLGVVLVANLSTVADTAPALLAFFDGSGM